VIDRLDPPLLAAMAGTGRRFDIGAVPAAVATAGDTACGGPSAEGPG
jgi:hypothetical protein